MTQETNKKQMNRNKSWIKNQRAQEVLDGR